MTRQTDVEQGVTNYLSIIIAVGLVTSFLYACSKLLKQAKIDRAEKLEDRPSSQGLRQKPSWAIDASSDGGEIIMSLNVEDALREQSFSKATKKTINTLLLEMNPLCAFWSVSAPIGQQKSSKYQQSSSLLLTIMASGFAVVIFTTLTLECNDGRRNCIENTEDYSFGRIIVALLILGVLSSPLLALASFLLRRTYHRSFLPHISPRNFSPEKPSAPVELDVNKTMDVSRIGKSMIDDTFSSPSAMQRRKKRFSPNLSPGLDLKRLKERVQQALTPDRKQGAYAKMENTISEEHNASSSCHSLQEADHSIPISNNVLEGVEGARSFSRKNSYVIQVKEMQDRDPWEGSLDVEQLPISPEKKIKKDLSKLKKGGGEFANYHTNPLIPAFFLSFSLACLSSGFISINMWKFPEFISNYTLMLWTMATVLDLLVFRVLYIALAAVAIVAKSNISLKKQEKEQRKKECQKVLDGSTFIQDTDCQADRDLNGSRFSGIGGACISRLDITDPQIGVKEEENEDDEEACYEERDPNGRSVIKRMSFNNTVAVGRNEYDGENEDDTGIGRINRGDSTTHIGNFSMELSQIVNDSDKEDDYDPRLDDILEEDLENTGNLHINKTQKMQNLFSADNVDEMLKSFDSGDEEGGEVHKPAPSRKEETITKAGTKKSKKPKRVLHAGSPEKHLEQMRKKLKEGASPYQSPDRKKAGRASQSKKLLGSIKKIFDDGCDEDSPDRKMKKNYSFMHSEPEYEPHNDIRSSYMTTEQAEISLSSKKPSALQSASKMNLVHDSVVVMKLQQMESQNSIREFNPGEDFIDKGVEGDDETSCVMAASPSTKILIDTILSDCQGEDLGLRKGAQTSNDVLSSDFTDQKLTQEDLNPQNSQIQKKKTNDAHTKPGARSMSPGFHRKKQQKRELNFQKLPSSVLREVVVSGKNPSSSLVIERARSRSKTENRQNTTISYEAKRDDHRNNLFSKSPRRASATAASTARTARAGRPQGKNGLRMTMTIHDSSPDVSRDVTPRIEDQIDKISEVDESPQMKIQDRADDSETSSGMVEDDFVFKKVNSRDSSVSSRMRANMRYDSRSRSRHRGRGGDGDHTESQGNLPRSTTNHEFGRTFDKTLNTNKPSTVLDIRDHELKTLLAKVNEFKIDDIALEDTAFDDKRVVFIEDHQVTMGSDEENDREKEKEMVLVHFPFTEDEAEEFPVLLEQAKREGNMLHVRRLNRLIQLHKRRSGKNHKKLMSYSKQEIYPSPYLTNNVEEFIKKNNPANRRSNRSSTSQTPKSNRPKKATVQKLQSMKSLYGSNGRSKKKPNKTKLNTNNISDQNPTTSAENSSRDATGNFSPKRLLKQMRKERTPFEDFRSDDDEDDGGDGFDDQGGCSGGRSFDFGSNGGSGVSGKTGSTVSRILNQIEELSENCSPEKRIRDL